MRLLEDFIDDIDVQDVQQNDQDVSPKAGQYWVCVVFDNMDDSQFRKYFVPLKAVTEDSHKARVYARRAELCLDACRKITNVDMSVYVIENNNFLELSLADPNTYKVLINKDLPFRGFKVTFDFNEKLTAKTMTEALCAVYKLTEDMLYKACGMSLNLFWHLSQYLSESHYSSFNGQMYRGITHMASLPGTSLNYLGAIINDVFGIKCKNIDLLHASEGCVTDDRTARTLINRLNMSPKEAAKFTTYMEDGSEKYLVELKTGETACLDDYELKDLCRSTSIHSVELTVKGTLEIRALSGYENLNCIPMASFNQCLKISTRVTPRILDWILTHLWFSELDLSDAILAQPIEIYPKDKGMRNKEIEITPNDKITIH
jgi:hypothetical protein